MEGRHDYSAQQDALNKLKEYGLTEAHFSGCDWFNTPMHVLGLSYFITAKHFPASAGIRELKDLHVDQIEGLTRGLRKEEVTGLFKYQIKALFHFGSWGVNNHLLRDKIWFNSHVHYELLKKLVFQNLMKPEIALAEMRDLNQDQMHLLVINDFSFEEMKNLTSDQCLAIITGYTRDEVLKLSHFQLQALIHPKFRKKSQIKLEPTDLIGKDWFNSQAHVDALIQLVFTNNHSIKSALEIMDKATEKDISYVLLGVSKEDIKDLNPFHLKAYEKLRSKGLTTDQLANKPWFKQTHVDAMIQMVTQPPYVSIEDALLILDDSDETWAAHIQKEHEKLDPYDKTDKFVSIFYFKTLDKILSSDNTNFEDKKSELNSGLNTLQESLQSSKDPQSIRKEIAYFFIEKVKKNTILSNENKIALLTSASKHAVFGHANPLSSAVTIASSYVRVKTWYSKTQEIFIKAIKEMKKNVLQTEVKTALGASM